MAASNTDARSQRRRTESRLSRYDLVLLVIPAAFVLALFVTQVAPVSLSTAMAAASTVGVLAVADGLFLNPPRRS